MRALLADDHPRKPGLNLKLAAFQLELVFVRRMDRN